MLHCFLWGYLVISITDQGTNINTFLPNTKFHSANIDIWFIFKLLHFRLLLQVPQWLGWGCSQLINKKCVCIFHHWICADCENLPSYLCYFTTAWLAVLVVRRVLPVMTPPEPLCLTAPVSPAPAIPSPRPSSSASYLYLYDDKGGHWILFTGSSYIIKI